MKRIQFQRLMRYHRTLLANDDPNPYVSSGALASHCGVDPTQVRKDLAGLGLRGRPNVGFWRAEIAAAITHRLGFDTLRGVVILGGGRLGRALADYPLFEMCALAVVAIFDDDPDFVGGVVAGASVFPIKALPGECRRLGVSLGIITPSPFLVPQQALEALVQAGVRAVWNFTPASLRAPDGVMVRDEQLSVDLAELAYGLRREPGKNHER